MGYDTAGKAKSMNSGNRVRPNSDTKKQPAFNTNLFSDSCSILTNQILAGINADNSKTDDTGNKNIPPNTMNSGMQNPLTL